MDEEIPRLRRELHVVPFDGGAQASRYLVQVDHLNYLVSPALKRVLDTLRAHQERGAGNDHASAELREAARLARQHLPQSLFDGAVTTPRRTPFVISARILSAQFLAHIVPRLGWLFSPLVVAGLLLLCLVLHVAVWGDVVLARLPPGSDALLAVLLLLVGMLLHELGHICACHRGGGAIGGIGVGLYLIFPVFYAEVTDAWRLPTRARARVDLGGLYFQALFLAVVDVVLLMRGGPVAAALSWLTTVTMLHTLNPFLKFDGYWLLSDLTGVVNLHARVGETLRRLLRVAMGRAPLASLGGEASRVLLPYALLSLVFVAGFSAFVLGRIALYRETLPPALAQWWQSIPVAPRPFDLALVLLDLAGLLALPALMLLALLFYLNRMAGYFRPRHPDPERRSS
ncbi:hypothetical protein E4634_16630 [Mangrovimicrobium sediminis]|uniref:Peptide zinc metalloprotease protein n=1 Tax=Mangrovimicrobium sediminis TaxID=2562682 RepID=A0A4Z0LWX7_9GAMM|nr:hypothetical protein [Haliea sp. SAOS-164]TGD71740.1 hypothetical protein E4634_16630 [Haliea sp. SAOS-164]